MFGKRYIGRIGESLSISARLSCSHLNLLTYDKAFSYTFNQFKIISYQFNACTIYKIRVKLSPLKIQIIGGGVFSYGRRGSRGKNQEK